ncbi:carboxypeptidase Q-like isoform X1 [Macrosteles quadrilineatus]|uniref:carboxypeptidase Q-like isoform X1 n=1 Tax=Macrosteles quadrilineatus TaxID=74068 RepID=UPI0023E1CFBD|nr:carboxypeptidase Q-like isoform X1 [Macrosteles quadrilineatus]
MCNWFCKLYCKFPWWFCLILLFSGCGIYYTLFYHNNPPNPSPIVNLCNVDKSLQDEIAGYMPVVELIVEATSNEGNFKGKLWKQLSYFVDKFGNRMTGTANLENSINYMISLLGSFGLDNIHGENVSAPHWVRGNESAFLISPRYQKLNMLGLGYSVGTPEEGITADVLVVKSFDELHERGPEAQGKIVVIAEDWLGSYGATVKYRSLAAIEVAKVGGVAALIRSITPFSINTPHTGMMHYQDGVTKIPAAALTVEDTQMLLRMSQRGTPLKIQLKMEAKTLEDVVSRNTVVELKGTQYPEKVVLVSGHLDSWDVGQGAMDDGGGAFISWGALALLKSLGLRPKRTIRAVLWTAEEVGLIGAQAYAKAHQNETHNFMVMMESDEGTFTPRGLEYSGSDQGGCIIKEILKLMSPIKATEFKNSSDVGSDITVWANQVPLLSNLNDNGKYFWFHHTDADTMSVMNSDDLDLNVALWAATAFVIADMSVDLPGVGLPQQNVTAPIA